MAVLVVYIDIVVTGNDDEEINKLKDGLRTEFEIQDLETLKYFHEIEVARSKNSIVISRCKYLYTGSS